MPEVMPTVSDDAAPVPGGRFGTLAAVGRDILGKQGLEAVLEEIVTRAAHLLGAERCGLFRIEPAGNNFRLRCIKALGLSARFTRDLSVAPGEGVVGRALTERRAVSTPDVLRDPAISMSDGLRVLTEAEGLGAVLAVPILLPDRAFGVLTVHRPANHGFTSEEVELATSLAGFAGIALENARLYGEAEARLGTIQRQHAAAQALLQVSQALTQTLDLELLFDLIAAKVLAVTGADACGISQITPAGNLEYVRAQGFSGPHLLHQTLLRGEGLMGRCLEQGTAVWSPDLQDDPDVIYRPEQRERVQMRGGLAVPIVTSDGPYGVLFIGRRRPHDHTPEEIAFAEALAAQAAVAIQNARLYQEERARTRDLAALIRAGRAVTSSLDLGQSLETIAAEAVELTGASLGYLMLVENGGLVRRACAGPLREEGIRLTGAHPIALGTSFSGVVASSGESLWVPDVGADERERYGEFNARYGLRCYLGVPVLAGGRVLGVLSVLGPPGGGVTEGRRPVLESLAAHAAIAIENARLFAERGAAAARAERQRAQAEALAAVGRAISASLDLDQVLALVVERAAAATGADAAAVLQRDAVSGDLHFRRAHNLTAPPLDQHVLPAGKGIAGAALQAGQPLWTSDLRTDWRFHGAGAALALVEEERIRGVLSVPIRAGEEPYGVLSLYWRTPHAFSEEETAFAARIADQAAVAIENARLYEETREALDELAAIHEAGRAITQSLNLQETLLHILGAALRLTETNKGIIWLLDEERQELVGTVAQPEQAMLRLPLSEPSFAAACLREGRTLISECPEDDPRCNPGVQARFQNKALVAVPLRSGARLIGILDLGDLTRRRQFAPREIAILERLAQQAVVAIENARLYAETRRAYEDLQAAQEQLVQVEKVRALGEMAGGVAHDFNNLLAAILGRVQLLRMAGADPRLDQGLAVIERAALDGAETVRRLLGFARVRPETNYAPVDLAAVIPQVLELTRPRWRDEAQGRAAPIEVGMELEPIPAVLGNEAELREVLVNLVFNAVDAMPKGGRLTLGARPCGPPERADEPPRTREFVEVYIRDTGIGMPAGVRRRAFDPFFTTKGAQGSGLGLSVAYAIVAGHGGEIRLSSQEGEGTTVFLRLPATSGEGARAVAPAPCGGGRTGHIVVVDDQPMVGDAMAELLESKGHRLAVFTDPRQALDHMAREGVDLLVTDLGMPEMSGWDLARQSRALHPDLHIILVTGWGDRLDPSLAREHRVNAILSKPFRVEDLIRLVGDLLPASAGR